MGKSPDEKNKDKTNLKLRYCCKNIKYIKYKNPSVLFPLFYFKSKTKKDKNLIFELQLPLETDCVDFYSNEVMICNKKKKKQQRR